MELNSVEEDDERERTGRFSGDAAEEVVVEVDHTGFGLRF